MGTVHAGKGSDGDTDQPRLERRRKDSAGGGNGRRQRHGQRAVDDPRKRIYPGSGIHRSISLAAAHPVFRPQRAGASPRLRHRSRCPRHCPRGTSVVDQDLEALYDECDPSHRLRRAMVGAGCSVDRFRHDLDEKQPYTATLITGQKQCNLTRGNRLYWYQD